MSKGISLINVGVGFIIIAGSIFVTGLFGLMAARRLVELAVLAVVIIDPSRVILDAPPFVIVTSYRAQILK